MNLLQRYFRRPQTLLLRRAIFQLHLWVGLVVALYMAMIGITGSVLVFRQEFDARALPRHWRELRTTSPATAGTVMARLNSAYPDLRTISLMAPTSFNPTFVATLLGRGRLSVACDPTTGEVLGP
ncbi:MAG: PepSY domain-containing protein, partial [bacterium]